jgi:hypothetical protein
MSLPKGEAELHTNPHPATVHTEAMPPHPLATEETPQSYSRGRCT